MKMKQAAIGTAANYCDYRKWIVGVTAVVAFLAGSFITAHVTHADQVSTDSQRVFELLVYHTVPGKVPALESRFREASKLQAKHHLDAVGYWVLFDQRGESFDPLHY